MPIISSIDATICAAMYALKNPSPEIPLVKLVNSHQEALRYLAEIFITATPPEVPLRVPIRGAYQESSNR